MKFDVLTLFPEMFESVFSKSIIARAIKNKRIKINYHNLRKWAWNSYGSVDDRPYGGDVGMLIRVDVVDRAIEETRNQKQETRIILLSARGKRLTQKDVRRLSKEKNMMLICGHYEGFDERISELVDEEISIGDYVLSGGEIPAMVLIDSISRLIPGVLGKDESSVVESFSQGKNIEHPQYTRPAEYKGKKVPEVLLLGDPKKIKEWQKSKSR